MGIVREPGSSAVGYSYYQACHSPRACGCNRPRSSYVYVNINCIFSPFGMQLMLTSATLVMGRHMYVQKKIYVYIYSCMEGHMEDPIQISCFNTKTEIRRMNNELRQISHFTTEDRGTKYERCGRFQLYTGRAMGTTSSSVYITVTTSSAMSYWLTQNSI